MSTVGRAGRVLGTRPLAHDAETMQRLWSRARRAGKVSTRLAGYYAERLWFTPWPTPTSPSAAAREQAWLTAASPLTVDFEGTVLEGFSAGSGPCVLLVHGWGDHAGRLGAFIEPLVAAGLRAVGITLPAHGPGARGSTNVYEMSRAIAATVDKVGGAHAIVAHSMGVTASALALRNGLPCAAVVALAPPTLRTEYAFERFGELLELPPRTMIGLRRAIERRFGPGTWQDVADALGRKPTVPALVIHDSDDPLVPLADAQAVADAWGVRLRTTAELGHARIVRDRAVVQQVVAFLVATVRPDEVVNRS